MTDLDEMLRTMTVSRRPGIFTLLTVAEPPVGMRIEASIHEDEGLTIVVDVGAARALGHAVEFEAAWLTLDVHSALEAVGLTAAFSATLAEAGIACNVLAGVHHDHLLVPVARAEEAIALLTAAADSPGGR